MTVSTVGATFFATARFDLALVTRFFGVALALVRFACVSAWGPDADRRRKYLI